MSGRGMAQKSLGLIERCKNILEEIQPTTVRSVCYQLFTRGLIESMSRSETAKVSRLLVIARETGVIPWEHVVDETREAEPISGWNGLGDYSETILKSYRRDFWERQPERLEVWSEKGTVRGILAPILNRFAVTFRVLHGFGSATSVHEVAIETEEWDRPLIVLYAGDFDPSGLHMSEVDLPNRLDRYGGNVSLTRIALTQEDVDDGDLRSFEAATKRGDPRFNWFVENHGDTCWELDAMSPNVLRGRVEDEIIERIDLNAWNHCQKTEQAERESMKSFFKRWPREGVFSNKVQNTPAEPQAPKDPPPVPVTDELKKIAAEVLTAEEWFNFIEEMTGEHGHISTQSFEYIMKTKREMGGDS